MPFGSPECSSPMLIELENTRAYRPIFDYLTDALETIQHHGPSIIGLDTIYRSQGEIPEGFLRGAGISDLFITYMRSLVHQPIVFASCFISYSSRDQSFAEHLYANLQSKGVRCWFCTRRPGDRCQNPHQYRRIDPSPR